jgi:hypothetical protein
LSSYIFCHSIIIFYHAAAGYAACFFAAKQIMIVMELALSVAPMLAAEKARHYDFCLEPIPEPALRPPLGGNWLNRGGSGRSSQKDWATFAGEAHSVG